jgi:hypothetical protein
MHNVVEAQRYCTGQATGAEYLLIGMDAHRQSCKIHLQSVEEEVCANQLYVILAQALAPVSRCDSADLSYNSRIVSSCDRF